MKIWISKNSEVPVREQLTTQITLGIASGDLLVGEKLSSTSELARRFNIHANTISSAYQKLGEQGLIEFKKGSGFFVCETKQYNLNGEIGLEALVANFFHSAQSQGFSKGEIQSCLQKWFAVQTPKQVFVIESDERLRAILIEEIRQITNLQVGGTSFEEFNEKLQNENIVFAAMNNEKAKIESILPVNRICFFLKARSVSDSMTGETRPEPDNLIAVVSGWEKFLFWSKTILIATNIESDSIILRLTVENDWKKGLKNASLIICDTLTAKEFTSDKRVKVFKIVADDSMNEINKILT